MSNMSDKELLFSSLPPEEIKKRITALTNEQAEVLFHSRDFNARKNQIAPPGDWYQWVVIAGRGFGKTKVGSWWILDKVKQGHKNIILVGATITDLERIMIYGDSGIINTANKWERPEYIKSDGKLIFYDNALSPTRKVIAVATCLSAQEPDRFRGLQCSIFWLDEFASYPYMQSLYDMLLMGHRLSGIHGEPPQGLITTTPRPLEILRKICKDVRNIVTNGNTFDNAANLAKSFLETMKANFGGTRLGQQEIEGKILDDNPNALFTKDNIHVNRVPKHDSNNKLIEYIFSKVVVAIDPAVSANATSDLTGIVVAGKGVDGHYYIIEDLSMKGKPHEWALVASKAYYRHKANYIVAEVNNGGDMVEETITNLDYNIPYKKVHATRGKILRAEPISLIYEQNKVHHIGILEELEEELTKYTGDPKEKSPDRFDAEMWAMHELIDNSNNGFLDFAREELERMKKEKEDLDKGIVTVQAKPKVDDKENNPWFK